MKKKMYKIEGVVEERVSNKLYLVKLIDGRTKKVFLSAKLRMHCKGLSVGAKVYIELLADEDKEGRFLSSTDFKTNGWIGWTEEHEPF